jgi:hypothetical protein
MGCSRPLLLTNCQLFQVRKRAVSFLSSYLFSILFHKQGLNSAHDVTIRLRNAYRTILTADGYRAGLNLPCAIRSLGVRSS